MRLLTWTSDDEFILTRNLDDDETPPYAILSHTWGADEDEVTFDDIAQGRGRDKAGYAKITFCGIQARIDNIKYFWVDTCCIDKRFSRELSESIASMFRWFQHAAKCYVYLSDVSAHKRDYEGDHQRVWELPFRLSRWFTRGWTLQELLAPKEVVFFSQEGEHLGTKHDLEDVLHEITIIPIGALRGQSLSQFPIDERMRWTRGRNTIRKEDKAYCLMGIFDVFMPIIYGEGEYAFHRLLRKIEDHSERHNFVRHPEGIHQSLKNELDESPNKLCYYPLGIDSFRLLILDPGVIGNNITGHIREYSMKNPPSYYALSYVWGQEPPVHRTVINDEVKFIQPNLYHSLQRIRPLYGQYSIWVDNLCINQDNSSERSMQVRQMSTIYSSASGVWIWLGEEDATSKRALEFISEITSDKFRWVDSWWKQYGFAALAQILERPWFRRGWVIQEAAFSKNSIILCGDNQVHMDHFVTAIKTVRDRLGAMSLSSSQILAKFHDSPAVRLIDTITGVFRNSSKGDALRRRMSLETLVELSTYSETTDQRDTIYAFLNLANDVASLSRPHQSDAIIPDYTKRALDVFVDFISHCCTRSGKLDIICRPWAPSTSALVYSTDRDNPIDHHVHTYPSWIVSKDKLPFGNPAWGLKTRLYGNPLVSRDHMRCYFTHYGSRPQISVGKTVDGICDGSLQAKGIMLGEIAERSARMADAIVTKECIDILRAASHGSCPDHVDVPDTIWRTLCADRDERGERAPYFYQAAMLHLLEISSGHWESDSLPHLLDEMSSIDPEEVLDLEMPEYVEQFLMVIRDVIWNRRTFRLKWKNNASKISVGLAPQDAKVGDQVCILYGCTVPVVLRQLTHATDGSSWHLIGDAYVHGIMDGEVISSSSSEALKSLETEFKML